jgi:hypothetical protein
VQDEHKRTLDELAILYSLHPEMTDVITEGNSDAGVFNWFLSEAKARGDAKFDEVKVFCIDDRVYFPPNSSTPHRFRSGARGKLLASAERMHDEQVNQFTVVFVADADFGYIGYDDFPDFLHLLYTDYTSIELYAFNSSTFSKLFSVALRSRGGIDSREVIASITPALLQISLSRLTLRDCAEGLVLPKKLNNYFAVEDGVVYFDFERAFRAALSGSRSVEGAGNSMERILEHYRNLEESYLEHHEPRKIVNGHDICTVLVFYLKKFHPNIFREDRKNYANVETLEKAIMVSLEYSDIRSLSLFQGLLRVVTRSGS